MPWVPARLIGGPIRSGTDLREGHQYAGRRAIIRLSTCRVAPVALGRAGVDALVGATKGMKMNPRVRLLKALVSDGLYVIDDAAVADAVLLRSQTRHMLPDVTFPRHPAARARGALLSPAPGREVVSADAR